MADPKLSLIDNTPIVIQASRATTFSDFNWQSDKAIVDTGATSHLEKDPSVFVAQRKVSANIRIQVASGETCIPDFVGTVEYIVQAIAPDGDQCELTIRRDNVICCTKLATALFSPRRDWETKKTRVVFEDTCELKLKNGYRIPFEENRGSYMLTRKYRVKQQPSPQAHKMPENKTFGALNTRVEMPDPNVQLWHQRLGHPSFDRMRLLPHTTEGTTGLDNIRVDVERAACHTCPKAKLKRASHPSHPGKVHPQMQAEERAKWKAQLKAAKEWPVEKYRTTQPQKFGDLIWADVTGPISTPSFERHDKYASVFVDEATNYCCVYTMQHKSDQSAVEKNFLADMAAFGGLGAITEYHSDNGGEYVSKEQMDFFADEEIKHTYSTPYTPNQNNKAEVTHWYLCCVARALLIHAGLPMQHWGQAMTQAAYLRNRLPGKKGTEDQFLTPYERLKGRKPNIRHVRVFGCLAHSLIHRHHRYSN